MTSENKRLTTILLSIPLLLLIPFFANMNSEDFNWSALDFVVMGMLLLGAGLAIELYLRKVKSNQQRVVFIVVVLILFLLTWAELAVGIFGSPLSGS